jgi:hypothetical protein
MNIMTHKIIEELNALKWNKEKVKLWVDYNLSPKWGLSAELTIAMFNLYADCTGSTEFVNKLYCGYCADQVWNRLKDFNSYGDNMGKPLLNWEAPAELKVESNDIPLEEPKKRTRKKKTD